MPYASADGAEGECSADVFDDAVGAWVAVGYAVISHLEYLLESIVS